MQTTWTLGGATVTRIEEQVGPNDSPAPGFIPDIVRERFDKHLGWMVPTHYDPARDLARLVPEHEVYHVALDKRSTYRQLKALAGAGYDIFVNLCEGYLDWDIPSIDVM